MVGCKSDLPRKICNRDIEAKARLLGIKHYETSAKTALNLESTFTQLAESSLPVALDRLDKSSKPLLRKNESSKIDVCKCIHKFAKNNLAVATIVLILAVCKVYDILILCKVYDIIVALLSYEIVRTTLLCCTVVVIFLEVREGWDFAAHWNSDN